MVIACSFPDVDFADETGGAETGTETTTTGDAAVDAPEDVEIVRRDGSTAIEAGRCDGGEANCDCDDDTFLRRGCFPDGGRDANAPNGPGGVAWDCDDFDNFYYPGHGFTDEKPTSSEAGADFNCNGVVEKAFPERGNPANPYNCNGIGLGLCSATQGFLQAVPCGVEQDYFKCTAQVLVCTDDFVEPKTQLCK
jgi:hypothetical protein